MFLLITLYLGYKFLNYELMRKKKITIGIAKTKNLT